MKSQQPRLIVYCSLFPSSVQPNAGVFIRERLFKVGQHCPIVVVSPVPWFPFQHLLRRFKSGFRPQPPHYENQQGVDVYFPRFFSVPGLFKQLDGFFMALGSLFTLYKLKKSFVFNIIDAHFAYPDGYAATLLGKWFKVPVTITLRGTEVPLSKMPGRKKRLLKALADATKIFSVADSLKRHVVLLGAQNDKIEVIGNGVDTAKFHPVDRHKARERFAVPENAKVLISVGGLVDRKGYHRVIEVLPALLNEFPDLIYIIVGGASPEGNNRPFLDQQIATLDLSEHVRFLGPIPSDELKYPLSAADVFVLATANEGWANVFLEAMACGLPVVTTDVGGNKEVVNNESLGEIVPFGNPAELQGALSRALNKNWNKNKIIDYAKQNAWQTRVDRLVTIFQGVIEDKQ
ncbi:glycosyltransferase [Methylicorpusculum sp.]|uniref:glycosyltransferase n=1 Tax=Methylicorpusculum sp. TaxID=2713644 RepID=UPI00272F7C81|nr:glycosyltransferase [Methylicorpusculum sp.]MDP2177464.1 glycosyltransferase [Methylicorpusculum sp.]MDP3530220.1 glycosyltransferase [Methylicorpusculum sp.]MDZ4154390.1 glycosyltransferase [Methylicorpusculum sp.]